MIMRDSIGVAGTGDSLMRALLVIVYFTLLLGCGYHPPAPIDEQSNAMVKRQLNSDGTYYVRTGDTLYAIAFGYGLDPMNIAKWNDISSPYVIYPGQRLRLSAPAGRHGGSDRSSDVTISTVKTPGQATTRTVSSSPKSGLESLPSPRWRLSCSWALMSFPRPRRKSACPPGPLAGFWSGP